jgi:DNA-binding GntR family transcriptional regulator
MKGHMTTFIHIEQFPQTFQLVAELRSEFAKGADTLVIVDNDQILGAFLSRGATQKALARKVAEQWIRDPDMLGKLANSLEEQPKNWAGDPRSARATYDYDAVPAAEAITPRAVAHGQGSDDSELAHAQEDRSEPAVTEASVMEVFLDYFIRHSLEGMAAKNCAEGSCEGKEELARIHSNMEQYLDSDATSAEAFRDADLKFHQALLRHGGFENFLGVMEELYDRINTRLVLNVLPSDRRCEVFKEHATIVEAIKAGNLVALGDALGTHIYNASIHCYNALIKTLGQEHEEQYELVLRSLVRAYKSGLERSSSPKERAREPHGT